MCVLCRKKQELLSKTGQWINKQASEAEGFFRPNVSSVSGRRRGKACPSILNLPFDFSLQSIVPNPHDSLDKRPKLERARSAAEKENQPLQRSSFGIRRQFSQQEASTTQRLSTSESSDLVQRHIQQPQYQIQASNSQQQSHYQAQIASNQPQDMYYEDPKYYQVRQWAVG